MTEKNPKIFISYTVRDGKINKGFLSKLENKISPISNVYIDLIHNNSKDKQKRVMSELKSSDMIFLIKTEEINESKWVKKEILLANKEGIPIYEFEFEDIIEKEFIPITKVIIDIKSLVSITELTN